MFLKRNVLFSSHNYTNFSNYSNGKWFIDRSLNSTKKSFKRNDSDLFFFFKCFQCFVPGVYWSRGGLGRHTYLKRAFMGALSTRCTFALHTQSLFLPSLQSLITDTHSSFVFSAFMAVEGSPGLEGDTALELTEQKTNVMVLDLCHKPGGSEYLRQIYHIMRLNEVGKRPFYRAIRCVLAWGSVCWQLRVSQGGDNTS